MGFRDYGIRKKVPRSVEVNAAGAMVSYHKDAISPE